MDGLQLPPGIRALAFDVGETLVDESRAWADQARQVGVTPFALMGTIGALIERGEDHHQAWGLLGVRKPISPVTITSADLYPDALGCLQAARTAGLLVGIAGNQPAGAVVELRGLGFDADLVASSAEWGISKPSEAFFERLVSATGFEPHEIMYVGDRVDNDIVPARAVGLRTAHIRRGPWGYIHSGYLDAGTTDLQLNSLAQLADSLAHHH